MPNNTQNNTSTTRRKLLAQLGTLSGMGIVISISAGCGGGKKSSASTNTNSGNTNSENTGRVQLTITWPSESAVPSRYIPAYAKSLVLDLYKADNPDNKYTIIANQPDTLPTTQTVTFQPIPADTYILSGVAKVEKGGQGTTVSSATSQVQVVAGQITRSDLTLNSTIRAVEIQGQPLKVTVGESLTLIGRALDPNNNVLLLPSGALTWTQVSGSQFGTVNAQGRVTPIAAGVMRVRLSEAIANIGAEADIKISPRPGLVSSAWPKFRGDAQNTGRGGGSGATGVKKWEFLAGDSVNSSPAIGSDGTIYIGCDDRKIYALNGQTGTKKWEFLTGGMIDSSVAISSDGTVYIGSNDGNVYALDGASGAKKWDFFADCSFYSSPAIGLDGTIYIGTGVGAGGAGNKIYALDGATGVKKWEFLTGGSVTSSPAIALDGTVYIGSGDGKIYALDGVSGVKKWEFRTSSNIDSSPAVGLDGTVYVGSIGSPDNGSVFYALDGATGAKKWEFLTRSSIFSAAIGSDGTVYFGTGILDGKVYALDGASGAKKWEFLAGGFVTSSPAVGSDGTIYIGSGIRADGNRVYALDGATGVLKWEFLTRGDVRSSPAVGSDGTVYIGSRDRKVYAIK
jgi:outer membrane protein assembly factor BamB